MRLTTSLTKLHEPSAFLTNRPSIACGASLSYLDWQWINSLYSNTMKVIASSVQVISVQIKSDKVTNTNILASECSHGDTRSDVSNAALAMQGGYESGRRRVRSDNDRLQHSVSLTDVPRERSNTLGSRSHTRLRQTTSQDDESYGRRNTVAFRETADEPRRRPRSVNDRLRHTVSFDEDPYGGPSKLDDRRHTVVMPGQLYDELGTK